MKKIICGFLLVSMVFSIVGCTKKETKQEMYITTATSLVSNVSAKDQYIDLLADFQTENPNIYVTDTTQVADDAWKSYIRSQFAAKKQADVTYFFNHADAQSFVEAGQVVSLDTIRAVYPNYCDNIKDEALESIREKDGNIYAIPIRGYWEGLYCNEDLFKTFNIPLVTDWDSLMYAIEAFNRKGITPIAASFSDIPNYWIEHAILSTGGKKVHSVNPMTPEEVPPEWVEGLTMLSDLYVAGAFAEESVNTKHDLAVDMYNKGDAAMILEGSWVRFDEKVEKSTRVVKFPSADGIPKDDQAIIAGFSMGFYISTEAWNDPMRRDACVKYVEHMTSNESIGKICVQDAPAFNIETTDDDSQLKQDGANMCKQYSMQAPIDSKLSKASWEYIISNTSGIVNSQLDPADVLKKAFSLKK